MPSFGSLVPAHWCPQAPRRAAPPLARELAARVAVADRAWGLQWTAVVIRAQQRVGADHEGARSGCRRSVDIRARMIQRWTSECIPDQAG